MTWTPYYRGDGVARDVTIAEPPPWRMFPRKPQHAQFQPPAGLIEAVNAALHLRRPMLITGPAGFGKSTVVDQVAQELKLGGVLRWHVTSRSTMRDALYRYDALARIHAQNTGDAADDIGSFLQLGPLGTALLPTDRPRALLIDEIDKSELDLPSDLLDVLERGEFEIPELTRYHASLIAVRGWESRDTHDISDGVVRCSDFPFIVMTSNGERDFPPAFLRRCVRFTMPAPTPAELTRIVRAHLGDSADGAADLIETFASRVSGGELLAIDQLLNAVLVLSGDHAPDLGERKRLADLLLRQLSRA
ncbi:ATPase [Amycolatopsis coloradensis]|uniref:ATPase n=1 Tax=Amycolatopsis coloradensis TaxID=76021 RepID=A0A1R0L037_9PSEU|nr:MoxR family ATPase [Amycolatopsis coloradensis]OLZ55183.1 ATPase [Amycolatopsis coloradensis]